MNPQRNTTSCRPDCECPDRAALSDLALGRLPLDSIDDIGRHVERCAACQTVLDSLDDVEDSIVRGLRNGSSAQSPWDRLDPSWAEQLRRAEGIGPVTWGGSHAHVSEAPLPDRLGQYELQEQIGRGGMGTVHKALHVRLKRHVAMKLLPAERVRDPQAVARFQREIEAVARLDHPNLVRAFDAGEAEGRHFLVMEYLEGVDLARLVRRRRGPLAVSDASEIIRRAALGLQHAHAHGLVHRDVKPSNLMLTSAGEVKVLDLGLARLVERTSDAHDATAAGQVLGTADFLAPEQARDTRAADVRSDVYALGATLYFLLIGRGPFDDAGHRTFLSKVVAHATEPPTAPGQLRIGVPDALDALTMKMLAKDPRHRFQTAAEVANAMVPFAVGDDLLAALLDRDAAERAFEPAVGEPKARRRVRSIALLITVSLAVAACYWAFRGNGAGSAKRGGLSPLASVSPSPAPSTLPAATQAAPTPQPEQIINSLEMTLRLIPAGTFAMGSPDSDADAAPDEKPRHEVRITRPFYLSTAKVTVSQFRRFMDASGYRMPSDGEDGGGGWQSDAATSKARRTRDTTWAPPGFPQEDSQPVTVVSWHDAVAFCEWLGGNENAIYRLPTEAQWEYACRAGTAGAHYFGTEPLEDFAWNLRNAGMHTWPVWHKRPNPWGLYDAYGNAREWVADWYDPNNYAASPKSDPTGPTTGREKVIRGSSFIDLPPFIRSAKRHHSPPDERLNIVGFRVVRVIRK